MALGAYGSSKSSSSGSSSYLSGGSSGGSRSGGGGSMSSGSSGSSCTCEFLIELTLEGPFDLVVSVTNTGTCPLDVLEVMVGDTHTSSALPATLAPGAFVDFVISTEYDLRGLTGFVTTTCYTAPFTAPT